MSGARRSRRARHRHILNLAMKMASADPPRALEVSVKIHTELKEAFRRSGHFDTGDPSEFRPSRLAGLPLVVRDFAPDDHVKVILLSEA